MQRYVEYVNAFTQNAKLFKKHEQATGIVFGDQHGRVSVMITVLPICAKDSFKPVRAILDEGETDLLLGLDIVRRLGITVGFGSGHPRDGMGSATWKLRLKMRNIVGHFL